MRLLQTSVDTIDVAAIEGVALHHPIARRGIKIVVGDRIVDGNAGRSGSSRAGCAGSNRSNVCFEGLIVSGSIAGRLGGAGSRWEGIAGAVMVERGQRQTVLPGVVAGDCERVPLIILTVRPFIVQTIDEWLVGVVEGGLARVFQSRIGVCDTAGEPMVEIVSNAKLERIVDRACPVWSKELIDGGEGLGAGVECTLNRVSSNSACRTGNSCARNVFATGVEIELWVSGVLEKVGVEPYPIMIEPRMDVVRSDRGAHRELALHTHRHLQAIGSADVWAKRLNGLSRSGGGIRKGFKQVQGGGGRPCHGLLERRDAVEYLGVDGLVGGDVGKEHSGAPSNYRLTAAA